MDEFIQDTFCDNCGKQGAYLVDEDDGYKWFLCAECREEEQPEIDVYEEV